MRTERTRDESGRRRRVVPADTGDSRPCDRQWTGLERRRRAVCVWSDSKADVTLIHDRALADPGGKYPPAPLELCICIGSYVLPCWIWIHSVFDGFWLPNPMPLDNFWIRHCVRVNVLWIFGVVCNGLRELCFKLLLIFRDSSTFFFFLRIRDFKEQFFSFFYFSATSLM